MVEAVEGVSDKGAGRGGQKHLLGVGLVEDDGSLYVVSKLWRTQHITAELEHHVPQRAGVSDRTVRDAACSPPLRGTAGTSGHLALGGDSSR